MELNFIEVLKIIFLGIVEGITEWLPISSTGHMLLVDEFLQLNMSEHFKEMFFILIQLGAICAVILLFWNKMWPFDLSQKGIKMLKQRTCIIWAKVVVACIPGALITIPFDDWIEAHLHTPVVIALMLILFGVAFIYVERWNEDRTPKINSIQQITYKTALYIGIFQVLSIIPGTSRSGATIIGALILGVSRAAAAEFTFFLAVPVMIGMSLLKIIKLGLLFTWVEWLALFIGMVVAFAVSLFVIRFLMSYIKKNTFSAFGWYRIVLGACILLYFAGQALFA